MRHPAAHAASPPRLQPHRSLPASQHPPAGPPPPGQHPAAARALKLPAHQLSLDLSRVRPYREHQRLQALHGPPGRTRPRDTGRAYACPHRQGAAANELTGPGDKQPTSSAHTMPETARPVGTLSAAQHAVSPVTEPLPAIAGIATVILGIPWWAHRRRRARVRAYRTIQTWPTVAENMGLPGSRIASIVVDVWGWTARVVLKKGTTSAHAANQ